MCAANKVLFLSFDQIKFISAISRSSIAILSCQQMRSVDGTYFRYLWRCNIHFAVARYGDGELAVMSGREYASETDLKNWSFKPDLGHKGYIELVNLMTDGFQLAAEHTKENVLGGTFIGLPFHFCAQGFRDFRMGGGGHYDWLMEYLTRFSRLLHAVNAHRLV